MLQCVLQCVAACVAACDAVVVLWLYCVAVSVTFVPYKRDYIEPYKRDYILQERLFCGCDVLQ